MTESYIPYGRQDIDAADIESVVEVLRSDWLTQGPVIDRFERAVAEYCGVRHAVAVSSATAALCLACRAAGLGPGDRLWTSANTFVASANCGLYCGATVDLVDIDPRTYNLSVPLLEEKLREARRTGTLPKVLVPVHFAGQSCEMDAIGRLADEYGFCIVEDASHAIGGEYREQKVGSCAHSAMTVFSFHPVKVITSGEGGMLLTNDDDLARSLAVLRSQGITRDETRMVGESEGPWYYQQIELSYNYRLTDIQAALGLSQMARLDSFVARRRDLAARYDEELAGLPVVLPYQRSECHSSWHLYVVGLQLENLAKTRRQIFDEMRAAGIGVNVHYIPVHHQPYYKNQCRIAGRFPNTDAYYDGALTLPLFPAMTRRQQDRVVETLVTALA